MTNLVFLVKTLLIRVKEIWVTPLFEASLNYQDALNIMHYLDQQTQYENVERREIIILLNERN